MSSSRRFPLSLALGPAIALALLAIVAGDVLSGVRALSAMQASWIRSVDSAQWALDRQARLQDAEDGETARSALALANAQRQAREALRRTPPDVAAARAAWQRAGVPTIDMPALQRMVLRYRGLPLMADAERAWALADEALERLLQVEQQLGALEGRANEHTLLQARTLRLSIAEQRAPLERSARTLAALLDDAARAAQRVATGSFLLLAVVLGAALGWTLLSLHQRQALTEQALRESNERWEMAAEGSCIGVFDWNVERRQVVLDPRAAAFWGFDVERPVVRSDEVLRLLVHRGDQARLRRELAVALQHRRSVELRFRVVAPDGDERTLELSGRASGEPIVRGAALRRARRMVGLLWDVSADVQSDRLRLEKEAAERASEAKTAFLSRVSHELRTPLNAVLGFAQLLQIDSRDPPSAQQSERIAHILAGGEHLLGLINDVLDLSVIDQGAFAVISREVELLPLLRGGMARLEPMARTRRVSLKLDAGDPGAMASAWRVEADPLRLEQVFMNLVSNAVKYNRLGGAVEVRVRPDGAWLRLEVHDTGPGLSDEQQTRLFQPFDRLGAEFGEVPGSGLGLVITRQLVERMGGTLTLRSEAGVGSTFTVALRRAAVAAAPAAAAGTGDARAING